MRTSASKPRLLNSVGEQVLDLGGDVVDEAREAAGGRPDRRVADEDAEAVGVVARCSRAARARPARAARAGGRRSAPGHPDEQPLHLAVDDDGVETLLAAEVLVDDRLGDPGLGRRSPRRRCRRNPSRRTASGRLDELCTPFGTASCGRAPTWSSGRGLAGVSWSRGLEEVRRPGSPPGDPSGGKPLRGRPADVVGPAGLLEPADEGRHSGRSARAARRGGRPWGRRGGGCARTHPATGSRASVRFPGLVAGDERLGAVRRGTTS